MEKSFEKNEYEIPGILPVIDGIPNSEFSSGDEDHFGRTTLELKNLHLLKIEKEVELFRKAKEHLEKREFHEAINLFRKLIEINNKEAAYHSYLGIALLKKGWDSYAQEEFKKALQCDPNNIIALIYHKDSKCTTNLNPRATSNLEIIEESSENTSKKGFFGRISGFFRGIYTPSLTEY